jgi:uncharacterized protein YndB with AHSA1/START domain
MPRSAMAVREQLSEREVIFRRLLDAPRELVWSVWTDPRHMDEWWGPDGFTTTTHEFSFVAGGAWRHIMHGPDGTDYPSVIVFREIVPPSRLVYDNAWGLPGVPIDFTVVAFFDAEGAKTRLSLHITFKDADAFKIAVERYRMLDVGTQTLDRRAAYVDRIA